MNQETPIIFVLLPVQSPVQELIKTEESSVELPGSMMVLCRNESTSLWRPDVTRWTTRDKRWGIICGWLPRNCNTVATVYGGGSIIDRGCLYWTEEPIRSVWIWTRLDSSLDFSNLCLGRSRTFNRLADDLWCFGITKNVMTGTGVCIEVHFTQRIVYVSGITKQTTRCRQCTVNG